MTVAGSVRSGGAGVIRDQLPDHIALSRDEVAVILLGLDTVDEAGLDADEEAKVKRAIRLLTTKLWPELGDLLDDEGGE